MEAHELKGKNGRRVLCEGVIEDDAPGRNNLCRVGFGVATAMVHLGAIREILPEPIKVGDRVAISSVRVTATVLAVDGPEAWIRHDDGCRVAWPLSELTLVEPGQ